MKISYIDLNSDHCESYSVKPKRYGGGRIFAAHAKEHIPDFKIFSDEFSFKDVAITGFYEQHQNCFYTTAAEREAIRNGQPIEKVLERYPWIAETDIFVHHFTNIHINTPKPQIPWSIGFREQINPKHTDFMVYDFESQHPVVSNPQQYVHSVVIGNIQHDFKEQPKKDFIFQCTRHCPEFGSIPVAQFCRHHKIKGVFAGPINKDYPLLNYIDNEITFYAGVISEEDKIDFTKHARMATFLHSWPTPFNLSAVESLSYGTPIVSTRVGFWPKLVVPNVNGFFVDSMETLKEAWDSSKTLSQNKCYDSVKLYSVKNMMGSFQAAIKSCYDNSKVK